jgi:glycosyltransferase involved in cell wall biosynthesis
VKIALLTDGITPFVTGGMQRHSANLAKYFTLIGIEVTLVHCVNHFQKLPTDSEVNGSLFGENSPFKLHKISSLHFPKSGKIPGHYIRNSYKYSKQIYSMLDWSEFDFVYAKGFCGWYFMEQKEKGVVLPKIGVKFHGYEMFQVNNSFSQKIKAKILQKATLWNNQHADYVFSYGGEITKLIQKKINIPNSKIIELTSGIDEEWIRKEEIYVNLNTIKFVFVGRNEKRKGVEDLNKALTSLMKDKNLDVEFHFIGPIPKENHIPFHNCYYHGELTNKNDLISVIDSMDVLICPSHSEGMPNVILEGMSRGLAVIATNVGAVNMIVDHSVGILISPFKLPELIKAITDIKSLNSNDLLHLKLNALNRVKNDFEWSVLVKELVEKLNRSMV